jgi:hypothetical protein
LRAEESTDLVNCGDVGNYISNTTKEAMKDKSSQNVVQTDNLNDVSPTMATGTKFSIVLDLDQRENEFSVEVVWHEQDVKPNLVTSDEHI